jgi:hypothetical protein
LRRTSSGRFQCRCGSFSPLAVPAAIRSTGIGWVMGLSRIGSFVGPLAIGILVGRGWQISDSFVALGTAALCAALSTSLIGINRGPQLAGPLKPIASHFEYSFTPLGTLEA